MMLLNNIFMIHVFTQLKRAYWNFHSGIPSKYCQFRKNYIVSKLRIASSEATPSVAFERTNDLLPPARGFLMAFST